MRVLVGCEFSQIVTLAFRARGHEAYSCDILPTEGDSTIHYQRSILSHELWNTEWDLFIAHPECTFLTSSGARWMGIEWRREAQMSSLHFVKALWAVPAKRIALENPIGRLSTLWQKPTQIIQPWMFGHGEVKATCLWLRNLPKLRPTLVVNEREGRVWKEPPSEHRWKNRSRTYQGIADAMADQW